MHTNHTGEEILKRLKALPEPITPKQDERYFYINEIHNVEYYIFENNSTVDSLNVKNRNAFATLEDAAKHAEFHKWLFSQPKMTLAECWKVACYDDELAPDEACAKHFIKLAKENGHI
jgi:hypothetical protein